MSETKTAEEAIELIKGRIMDEYRKHQTLDWSNIAARKIHSQWFEYYNQQNQELQSKTFTLEKHNLDLQLRNQELQRQIQQLKEDASYINGTIGDMLGEHKELNDGLQRQVEELKESNESFKASAEGFKQLMCDEAKEKKEIILILEEKQKLILSQRIVLQDAQSQYTQLKDAADAVCNRLILFLVDGHIDTISQQAVNNYKHLTNKP